MTHDEMSDRLAIVLQILLGDDGAKSPCRICNAFLNRSLAARKLQKMYHPALR
jgi:hypothetical protein